MLILIHSATTQICIVIMILNGLILIDNQNISLRLKKILASPMSIAFKAIQYYLNVALRLTMCFIGTYNWQIHSMQQSSDEYDTAPNYMYKIQRSEFLYVQCTRVEFNYNPVTLKVLGKSVGLCKTTKRKDQLYISLLVSVWRNHLWKFQPQTDSY